LEIIWAVVERAGRTALLYTVAVERFIDPYSCCVAVAISLFVAARVDFDEAVESVLVGYIS